MTDDRYVVREITGYPPHSTGSGKPPTTDVWVADREYCWREVAVFRARVGVPLRLRRIRASALASRLNAEEREWRAAA